MDSSVRSVICEAWDGRDSNGMESNLIYYILSYPTLLIDLSSTEVGELVVKAQIHAGGRGKGTFDSGFKGGVHLCKT